MNKIFTFIFETLRDIFNFLDFTLPGISLTFMDFLLLVIIIPIIFRLVKGVIGESGDGLIYSAFNTVNKDVESYSKMSYKNYEKNRERRDNFDKKYKERHPKPKKEGAKK